jgi:hypothetical protein
VCNSKERRKEREGKGGKEKNCRSCVRGGWKKV